jgi:hypothetical protein
MNKLVSTMHDATHLVPGVPAHDETRAARYPGQKNHSPRIHNRTSHQNNPRQHHQAPPRVLVGWQNWIARGFRRNGIDPS